MNSDAIWNAIERIINRELQQHNREKADMVAEFFQELRVRHYSLWIHPRAGHGVFWLERGDSRIIFHSLMGKGDIYINAIINRQIYHVHLYPLGMTTEVKALLDLLIAQPEEGAQV